MIGRSSTWSGRPPCVYQVGQRLVRANDPAVEVGGEDSKRSVHERCLQLGLALQERTRRSASSLEFLFELAVDRFQLHESRSLALVVR